MTNRNTEAALRYHLGTNHPDGSLMDRNHVWDPMNPPLPFKLYRYVDSVPLALDGPPTDLPALTAISVNDGKAGAVRTPGFETLSRILHFSAGITKTLRRPGGPMAFRAAACTGALFHIELYVVCGDIPGLHAGVYHYDPDGSSLDLLREGDHRLAVANAAGGEPGVAAAPATIVFTDVTWRNACKYQAREYRHAFWDCGTVLANTLAMCSASGVPARVAAGFMDDSISELLGLDPLRELPLAVVPLGSSVNSTFPPQPPLRPDEFETAPISTYEIDFPAIREMHASSSLVSFEEAESWRVEPPQSSMPTPAGRLTPLRPQTTEEDAPPDSIESVILRRGSTRRFSRESLSFAQLSTALERATRGVPADFLAPPASALNDIYVLVNAVDGLARGAYVFHRDRLALETLREGEFRAEAGFLGLGQALAADASVNIFFMCDLAPVLEGFGNRGYRAAQLDASITAGRIYLASYAQRFGATGLTFYDDQVTDFFSPHARGKSVMFMVSLGKRGGN